MAIHPSVSLVVPYLAKWCDADMARLLAAEPIPNGPVKPGTRDIPPMKPLIPYGLAPDEAWARIGAANVACHTVRKHTTWRTSPAATAPAAAITEPPGPNVPIPPLYQTGRIPRASSTALTPP